MEHKKRLLRIHVCEFDKIEHTPLYEAILFAARKENLSGGTVYRGIMSYGPNSPIHSSKILDLSSNLPIIIDIIDDFKKIENFLINQKQLFEKASKSGLVYTLDVDVRA